MNCQKTSFWVPGCSGWKTAQLQVHIPPPHVINQNNYLHITVFFKHRILFGFFRHIIETGKYYFEYFESGYALVRFEVSANRPQKSRDLDEYLWFKKNLVQKFCLRKILEDFDSHVWNFCWKSICRVGIRCLKKNVLWRRLFGNSWWGGYMNSKVRRFLPRAPQKLKFRGLLVHGLNFTKNLTFLKNLDFFGLGVPSKSGKVVFPL